MSVSRDADIREKHEYLMQYRQIERAERHTAELLAAAGGSYLPKSPIITDMPKGGGVHDLSDIAVRRYEIAAELCRVERERLKIQIDILKRIHAIDDIDGQQILIYAYIDGLREWQICQKMGFSEKSIQRKKRRALQLF